MRTPGKEDLLAALAALVSRMPDGTLMIPTRELSHRQAELTAVFRPDENGAGALLVIQAKVTTAGKCPKSGEKPC